MAIVNPQVPLFDRNQDGTVTVTLASGTDISAWAVAANLYEYAGGTPVATKTVGSGVTSVYAAGVQTWVITFTDDDLDRAPGGYIWDFRRTDAGAEYAIVERSAFIIRPDAVTGGPTLTNLSEFAIHALGGVTPSTDALAKFYTQLLFAAEARVRRYCDRQLTRAVYTEYPVSTGGPVIRLRETPVSPSALTFSLSLDRNANTGQVGGDFQSSTLLTYGTDYWLDLSGSIDGESHTGLVYRQGTFWPARGVRPAGPDGNLLSWQRQPWGGVIRVTYVGGYALVPYDLKSAVWTIANQLAFMAPYGSVFMSESGEGRSYTRMSPEVESQLFASVQNTLAPFRPGRLMVA